MNVFTRIYNHLFSPSTLINFEPTQSIEGMNQDAMQLHKYGILRTERNMKATILAYEKFLAEHTQKRPLFIFQGAVQCEYTSSHASSGEYDFDTQEYARAFKDGNAEVAKFRHILSVLNSKNTQLSEFYGKINLGKDPEELAILTDFKHNYARFLDEEIIVCLCPTKNPVECFARMINGYFIVDMQPHQLYALIKFMQGFGYEFMGIGDSLAMFYKTRDLGEESIRALYDELGKIYALKESQLEEAIGFVIRNKKHLVLPYVESLKSL